MCMNLAARQITARLSGKSGFTSRLLGTYTRALIDARTVRCKKSASGQFVPTALLESLADACRVNQARVMGLPLG